MKLFRSANALLSLQNHRSSFKISTIAAAPAASSFNSLFARVSHDVDRRASIFPILEKWIEEGNQVEKRYLQGMVKKLRKMKRFAHALDVSLWMSDRRYFSLSAADQADRLDLIYKVRGLEHVENYFNNLPKQMKVYQTYGALLSCYVQHQSVEKVEFLFATMKELGILTSFSYNMLMTLYSRIGQHEKVESIFHEMNEKGIKPDAFTDSILLNDYATTLSIKRMEEVIRRMEKQNSVDPHMNALAARAYMKAGIKDKALARLKMAEELIPRKYSRYAWGFLLTLYAEIGNKDELYRIWNVYKSPTEKASNSMYICMMSGLSKLDDISGAEGLFEEWKSQFVVYDERIPRLLISAYCKKGLLSRAEGLARETIQSGETLPLTTWGQLADSYFEAKDIPKAVEMMKEVVSVTYWKPKPENVNAGLKYFEEQKHVQGAEEFAMLVQKHVPLTKDVYQSLIRTYSLAGKPVSGVLDRMKSDGFDVDEETDKIMEGSSAGVGQILDA